MRRIASVLGLLLALACPALAQEERDPALEAQLGIACKTRYDT